MRFFGSADMYRILAILALVSPFITAAVWMWLVKFKKRIARATAAQAGVDESLVLEQIKKIFYSCTRDVHVRGLPPSLENEVTLRLLQELSQGKKLFEEVPQDSLQVMWPRRQFREFKLCNAYIVGCVWTPEEKVLLAQLEYIGYTVHQEYDVTDTPFSFGATWKLVYEHDAWKLDDVSYSWRAPSFWYMLTAKNIYRLSV